MANLKEPKSYPVNDLSDSDTERHPAEALIIRKAEQASSSAPAQAPRAREPGQAAVRSSLWLGILSHLHVSERTAHFKPTPLLQAQQEHQAVKQPAVLIAANPALAKARDPGKTSGKPKRKKRQRDSRPVEPDPGEHSPWLKRFGHNRTLFSGRIADSHVICNPMGRHVWTRAA